MLFVSISNLRNVNSLCFLLREKKVCIPSIVTMKMQQLAKIFCTCRKLLEEGWLGHSLLQVIETNSSQFSKKEFNPRARYPASKSNEYKVTRLLPVVYFIFSISFIFEICFHNFSGLPGGLKGPQIISSELDFMDIAVQRKDGLSQSQFYLPQEGSSWVSGPSLNRSPVTTWSGYRAEGHLQKVILPNRLASPRIGQADLQLDIH